jgi:hypothetical protein
MALLRIACDRDREILASNLSAYGEYSKANPNPYGTRLIGNSHPLRGIAARPGKNSDACREPAASMLLSREDCR